MAPETYWLQQAETAKSRVLRAVYYNRAYYYRCIAVADAKTVCSNCHTETSFMMGATVRHGLNSYILCPLCRTELDS